MATILTSTLDILQDALQKSGELQTSSSPYYNLALTYMNTVYRDVIAGCSHFAPDSGEAFMWARAQNPGTFVLKQPYATGNVTATAGSDLCTFSSAPSYSVQGYYLKFQGFQESFRVLQHVAGAVQFQIDTPFTDVTITGSFNLYKLDYVIGQQNYDTSGSTTYAANAPQGIARLVQPFRVDRPQSFDGDGEGLIYGIDPISFAQTYPRFALTNGLPVRFCVVGELDGQYTVRFNKSVTGTDARCEYDYIPLPMDLQATAKSIPLFPREDRSFLSYATAFHIMVDKSDTRADTYFKLAQAKLQSMFSERRREYMKTGHKMAGRLVPRTEQMQFALIRSASGLRF